MTPLLSTTLSALAALSTTTLFALAALLSTTLSALAALAALPALFTLPTLSAFAKSFAHLNRAVEISSSIKLFKGIHHIARASLASCVRNNFLPIGWIVEAAQLFLDFGHRRHIATRLSAPGLTAATRLAAAPGLATARLTAAGLFVV